MNELAETVRKQRSEQGLSQRELAERAGVDHTYISHIEAGRRENLTLGKLRSLADALGVSPSELMGWRGNPT